jgi:hypothetical protein
VTKLIGPSPWLSSIRLPEAVPETARHLAAEHDLALGGRAPAHRDRDRPRLPEAVVVVEVVRRADDPVSAVAVAERVRDRPRHRRVLPDPLVRSQLTLLVGEPIPKTE